jgi:DNA modification methylase
VPKKEKHHGYHPTQKPLRLVRRALLASTQEGDLVFDPFCGSGTTGVAAKELDRFFVGTELEEEFAGLAARRIKAVRRGGVLVRSPASKMVVIGELARVWLIERQEWGSALSCRGERRRHLP